MSDRGPSDLEIETRTRSAWRNLSWVWLVPLAALAVTLGVAWKTWADRGRPIEIVFENASGVVADETTVRYRDVVIGSVERVGFVADLSSIVVTVRVDRTIADSLPENARFWVVRPEVSTSGVTGLTTVLSGVYIEAAFEPSPGAQAERFVGLKQAPLVAPGTAGTTITLRTDDAAQLTAGAPIFHKGIEVGRIEQPELLFTRDGVVFDAFIEEPYNELLNSATRFWLTSGFSLSLGTGGLDLSVGSLANLVRGGLSFDTVFSGGVPVTEGQVFELYESEDAARSSAFSNPFENAVELVVEFKDSVSGLSAGSPVNLRGVRIGSVSAINAIVREGENGREVRLRATLSIDPSRLGLGDDDVEETTVIDFLSEAVREGLRARLGFQSLFSQALVVELVRVPEAEPAALVLLPDLPPQIPSVQSELPNLGATAEGLLARIDNLPVEEVLDQAIATMAAIETFAADEGLREAPDALVSLLDDARGLVGSEDIQALPGEINAAVSDLRTIISTMEQAGAVDQVLSAFKSVDDAANSVTAFAGDVSGAADEVTELIKRLQALTDKANELELNEFLTSARELVESADRLIDSDATRDLPASLTAALDEARGALADLREGGAVENINATLASAGDAAEAVEEAAGSLPEIANRIDLLVNETRSVVASYGTNSNFNRETLNSLREIQNAAEALSKLARALERNPNSILFGR
ncbi:MAG: MCE family protein [Maritimibacter sp.]|jgi:paraquat-inducible protein B|uniref:MlaD family protein n=1 Tax=Maritimibacter sp. TaxID=2003363 RepID=UPI001DEC438E|nr:MlaD family protein [Maritimibacter sp.]MBL6426067.1 MCE family protein [Maritimibacter sp.]